MKAITLRTSRTGWGAQIRGQQTDQNMCHLLSNSKLYHKKRKIKKASKLPKVLSHLKHRIRWFQEKINEHSRTRKYTNSKKKKKREKNSDQCLKKFRPTNLLRRKLKYLKELWYSDFPCSMKQGSSRRLVGSQETTWEGLYWENLGKKQWSKKWLW